MVTNQLLQAQQLKHDIFTQSFGALGDGESIFQGIQKKHQVGGLEHFIYLSRLYGNNMGIISYMVYFRIIRYSPNM